jgi:hypothetical protein
VTGVHVTVVVYSFPYIGVILFAFERIRTIAHEGILNTGVMTLGPADRDITF